MYICDICVLCIYVTRTKKKRDHEFERKRARRVHRRSGERKEKWEMM